MFFLDLTHQTDTLFEQLQLEEALLRADDRNWCIVRHGAPLSVVMGISGKVDELLNVEAIGDTSVIRRFSGGGTVVVNQDTLFVTLIGNHSLLPCAPFPCPIMKWTASIYRPVLGQYNFALRENDYVLGERKCGGNAQSLIKGRFLHHTSFLWDFSDEQMGMLKMPARTPQYREGRGHSAFLCRLKEFLSDPDELFSGVKDSTGAMDASVPWEVLDRAHRQGTSFVELTCSQRVNKN